MRFSLGKWDITMKPAKLPSYIKCVVFKYGNRLPKTNNLNLSSEGEWLSLCCFLFRIFLGGAFKCNFEPQNNMFFFWGGGCAAIRRLRWTNIMGWIFAGFSFTLEGLQQLSRPNTECTACLSTALVSLFFFFVWIHIPHIEHRGRVESTPNIMQNSWGTEWWALGIPYKLWNWVVPWSVGNVALWVGEELH